MNLQLLTDLYEFSMANGYYATLPHDRQARFDVFTAGFPTTVVLSLSLVSSKW